MNTQLNNSAYRTKPWTGFSLLGLCLLLLSACATTQKVAINQADLNCAFLANDCSLLTVGGKDQVGLRYLNPSAQWTQYNKIMIDPVTFWSGDSSKVSPSNQQTLVNFFPSNLTHSSGRNLKSFTNRDPAS